MWGAQGYFDTTPKKPAWRNLAKAAYMQNVSRTHLGNAAQRDEIKQIGLSAAPAFTGEKRPQNLPVAAAGYNGSDSDWSHSGQPGNKEGLGTIDRFKAAAEQAFLPRKKLEFRRTTRQNCI